jgi:hypothetical protein
LTFHCSKGHFWISPQQLQKITVSCSGPESCFHTPPNETSSDAGGGGRGDWAGENSLSLICIRQTLKNNEKLIFSGLRAHKHERINKDDAAGKQIINYSRS